MKSGSNDYHGSLFEFFRNEKLNARNLFATTGPKPCFAETSMASCSVDPIQKQKTFFFTDYQGSKQLVGVVRTSTGSNEPATGRASFRRRSSTRQPRRCEGAVSRARPSPATGFPQTDLIRLL
jgi:hypothetical protein